MARSRQVIVMRSINPADDDGEGMPVIGSVKEVQAILSRFNTGHDGAPPGKNASMGMMALHGPGFIAEIATATDDVRQILVTITDDDFAFPVLTRFCREQKWTLMDPESGQRLKF